ncbi:hypothetical protein CVU82_00835 [Candidatus Falkowbacteria bacterium HGW-Falkowbacteria-1]|jgi:putative hydrolase of HD superfamily|uniref:HD domain-containing protein n=1 Tax=Candidatus Falkowbacteria bacterium HGW-Falkowbacteria-1 TaxID=2013768 RepID=A0A2N2EAN1_9BACT|nr:MAG: hypothetical protein CVU82_00835 [Candidatus Falkowbacteria bacterium HGW-Falkowbacteria-1]
MSNKNYQYPLNFQGKSLTKVVKVIDVLHKTPRTGWVDRKVKDPETVGEHTDELVFLAEKLFNIPGLNKMLKIHDWPESDKNVGDRRTDNSCPKSTRWTKDEKYQAELTAMKKICLELGIEGKKIFKLWLEFEEKKTERSQIAHQLDKLQMIVRAAKYQKEGQPIKVEEFIKEDGDKIKHPILKRVLDQAVIEIL